MSLDTLAATLESSYHTCTTEVMCPPSHLSHATGFLASDHSNSPNAGKLVSHEDLRKKLWPVDTFVDFDVGLNSAIRKLRQALNDEADSPRYIETLAKRGYRLRR